MTTVRKPKVAETWRDRDVGWHEVKYELLQCVFQMARPESGKQRSDKPWGLAGVGSDSVGTVS